MSSPVILSIATIFALVGIVLAAIAFGTDNWIEYRVERNRIFERMRLNESFNVLLNKTVNTTFRYHDRTYGLFRVCFPASIPTGSNAQKSPFGAQCAYVDDYQIPEDTSKTEVWTAEEWTRMHLMRTQVAFYILGLFFLGLTLFTGIAGCWRRHAGLILATGILLLFATLFLAASMAVWHGIDYLTREVIRAPGYEMSWEEWLRPWVSVRYGWSYIVSWVGIALILVSSLLMLGAYRSMKEEEADEIEKKAAPYMMASYYDKAQLMPYGYGSYPAGQYPPYSNPYAYAAQYGSQYGMNMYGYR
jgi:hypothetical protein